METNKNIVDFMKPRERESISDDYLNGLVSQVMSAVKEERPIKIVPFYKKTVFWFSNVAAVILIFVLIQFNNQPDQIVCDFDSVSQSELLAYIDDNIEDFDQDLLLTHVPEKSLVVSTRESILQEIKFENTKATPEKDMQKTTSFDLDQFNTIKKEDILDYLEEEELNYEDLQESQDLF